MNDRIVSIYHRLILQERKRLHTYDAAKYLAYQLKRQCLAKEGDEDLRCINW